MTTVAEIVTGQIIKGLEMGKIPWEQPWVSMAPHNFTTNHRYQGINILMTALSCEANQWKYPLFASYKQIAGAGGQVQKGARGTMVVYSKMLDRQEVDASGHIEETHIPLLRYYHVFNIEQTDMPIDNYVKTFTHTPLSEPEALLHAKNPTIKDAPAAYFNRAGDYIGLPALNSFPKVADYYRVAFHELTHWTGTKSRLDRHEKLHWFGDDEYSKEELVAEIGANMLGFTSGIDTTVTRNSQAYINNWLGKLREDSRMIITAASKAQQAHDYLTK
jgi:antirestriction protein ArdC